MSEFKVIIDITPNATTQTNNIIVIIIVIRIGD